MNFLRKLFFNFWYYRRPPWDTGVSPPELISYLETHPSGRAMDLGCGTGTNVITMAKYGWQVTGVDFARRAIDVARDKARKAGVDVDLIVDDVTHLSQFPGPYDLILDIGCFHSLPQNSKGAYIRNLKRLLSAEGTYLMYGFYQEESRSGTGLSASDLQELSQTLDLVKREEGTERGHRPSVWLWYSA
jgi:cyclopropane fatty-acyl-phospholipid synthase-like methyltransferase